MLLNYKTLLEKIENNIGSNHLLLGNGFNNSLGVNTSYEKIFDVMKQSFSIYKNLNIKDQNYDLEGIIGALKKQISQGDNKQFLDKFINNKVKLDFMKSAYTIINSNIKDIYNEKNIGIGLLFKNFNNFFTLNFDPFLYLLLMKYKKNDNIVSFQSKLEFKIQDFENTEVQNYLEIYNNWKKQLRGPIQVIIERPLNKLTKVDFTNQLKEVLRSQGKKINYRILDLAYEKLTYDSIKLDLNDCFKSYQNELIYNRFQNQNVFFLHGAFHIYEKNNGVTYKINKTQNKALYRKIEEILDDKNEELICVFTDNNKKNEIQSNEYLKNGFIALSKLEGKLFIIGSSLDDNDKHVIEYINKSKIDEIYYSSSKQTEKSDRVKLTLLFHSKKIFLFDRDSISYN